MPSFAFTPAQTKLSISARVAHQLEQLSFRDSLKSSPPPELPQGIPFPAAYDFFMNPLTPILFGIIYFILAKTLSYNSDGKDRMQGKRWNVVIFVHNVILAVYSGWTFASVAPAFFGAFYRAFAESGTAGLVHVFCDSDLALWAATKFPFFCYIFYLSKFYEVLDTVIILAKGKKVGMLQSYHHTGAIYTMYAGYRTMSMPIWIFVVFNSGIHTLMYVYYATAAAKLPFPTFLKKSLTKLQITQFLVGGSLAASYLFIELPTLSPALSQSIQRSFGTTSVDSVTRMGTQCVADKAQRAAVWLNVFYLIPLTYLFAAFFFKSYQKSSAKARADKAKAASTKSQ